MLLSLLPKNKDAEGKLVPFPILNAPPQGASNSFQAAYYNPSAANLNSFWIQLFQNNSTVYIDNQAMLAAQKDIGAFVRAAAASIDPAMKYQARRINFQLFGDGSGVIGQIASITSSVIQLADLDSVTKFEYGQMLVAVANPLDTAWGESNISNGSTSAGGPVANFVGFVIAIDRGLGQITVSTTAGGSAATPYYGTTTGTNSWIAGLYLRPFGDGVLQTLRWIRVALEPLNQPYGLAGWLPTTSPSSTTFYGVNRSLDATRLGGVRYNGQNQSIEEAIISGSTLLNREGGHPDVCIMNFSAWSSLAKSLESKVIYLDHQIGDISFQGFKFMSGTGSFEVFADKDCPSGLAYLLDTSSWRLLSLGDTPRINNLDGNMLLRAPNGYSSLQAQIFSYWGLACNAPGHNAVVQITQ